MPLIEEAIQTHHPKKNNIKYTNQTACQCTDGSVALAP